MRSGGSKRRTVKVVKAERSRSGVRVFISRQIAEAAGISADDLLLVWAEENRIIVEKLKIE